MCPNIRDKELLCDKNYTIYRRDRTQRRDGGVLLAIKNDIASFIIDTFSDLEIIWAACRAHTKNILIGRNQSAAIKRCPTDRVYLFDEFNLPNIDWPTLSSPYQTSTDLINLSLDFNFSQVVNKPTRGTNILDLVLTTALDTIDTIEYYDGFSDHTLLQLAIHKLVPNIGSMATKFIRNYNRADYKGMNNELAAFFHQSYTIFLFSLWLKIGLHLRTKCQSWWTSMCLLSLLLTITKITGLVHHCANCEIKRSGSTCSQTFIQRVFLGKVQYMPERIFISYKFRQKQALLT